jgi:hypothetical protein
MPGIFFGKPIVPPWRHSTPSHESTALDTVVDTVVLFMRLPGAQTKRERLLAAP